MERSTGRGASITCSSTPGSTCCRRRSIACCGARTESFHLGVDYSTIDLGARGRAAEVGARPRTRRTGSSGKTGRSTIRFASAGEAAALPLRKESKREGTLRLVDVAGVRSVRVRRHPCLADRRDRDHRRLRDRAVPWRDQGHVPLRRRAVNGFRALRDAVAGSVRALSVLPAELPAAIERLQGEGKELRRQVKDFQSKVAAQEADALADGATTVGIGEAGGGGAGRMGRGRPEDHRLPHCRAPRTLAVLVSDPAPAAIVIARASDLAHDAGALLRAIVARHGGKGGGRPEMAQGGGLTAPAPEILATARELVAQPSWPRPPARQR